MVASDVRVAKARVVFQAPGVQVNGLEAVADGLWLSDQRNDRTYLIDYSGKVLTSFTSPARNASGTTYGSGSVWIASNVRPSMIYRHDPWTGQCTAGLILPNASEGGVHGVQWRPYRAAEQRPAAPDGGPEHHANAPAGRLNAGPGVSGTLWVTRPGQMIVEHLDAETGELLGQIPFPKPRSHGCFWDEADGTLSVAETYGGHVFRLNPKNGDVVDEFRVEGAEVHGMTRDAAGRIWIGDASNNMVSVIEP